MQRCKIDGGSTKNLVDRISELPEALIVHILSLLPTKVAITTSVLSKQWKSHWKMLPKLKFDTFNHRLELRNVCRSLLSHKAPVLQSFHLKVRLDTHSTKKVRIRLDTYNVVDTGILIGIALPRNVRELVLKVYFYNGSFTFPASFYNCETLETLHLRYVNFKEDESILNLLSGCPDLQDLVVHRVCNVKTFTIAVPSLQRLSIYNVNSRQPHWGYVINAPSLKCLKIEGFKALDESCLIENVPELLGSLTSVKRLSLSLSPLKIKTMNGIFNQLEYLELYTNKKLWWNLLTLMLGSSPKLQVLKLINLSNHKCWKIDLVARGEWNQPKNVPECLLLHLETFMWKGYKWQQKEEREVAKYILKNSNHLKRAIFSSKRFCSEDRLVVVKELKSVVKDTNSCQFQFKWNI